MLNLRRMASQSGSKVRWLPAVVPAFVVAICANLVLAPDPSGLIPATEVEAASEFTSRQAERGRDFRRPQTLLGLAALGAQLTLLVALTRRPPQRLFAARPTAPRIAAAGGGLSLLLTLASLPFAAAGRQRSVDVGLTTDTWFTWVRDQAVSAGVTAAFAAALAVIALTLMRWMPRFWWLPASGVIVAAATAIVLSGPLLLDPLFNRFKALPSGAVRSDILALARAADVTVSEVYVMDASRRTTGGNAYVAGLGPTKRIVLYDNVVRDFPRAEIRSIVAHELGHQHYADLGRGLVYLAIVAPFGLLAVASITTRTAPSPLGAPAALPSLALSFLVVSTGITWISNSLSRAVEARADAYALRITEEPGAFVDLQRRLAVRNVSDVDPPAGLHAVLGTHPSVIERIGMARTLMTEDDN